MTVNRHRRVSRLERLDTRLGQSKLVRGVALALAASTAILAGLKIAASYGEEAQARPKVEAELVPHTIEGERSLLESTLNQPEGSGMARVLQQLQVRRNEATNKADECIQNPLLFNDSNTNTYRMGQVATDASGAVHVSYISPEFGMYSPGIKVITTHTGIMKVTMDSQGHAAYMGYPTTYSYTGLDGREPEVTVNVDTAGRQPFGAGVAGTCAEGALTISNGAPPPVVNPPAPR